MRAPAPLPLRAPGLGRRLTLVTRRVASAGEQPSHAARPGHAVRHPGCGNRERERSLPVTCNHNAQYFFTTSFIFLSSHPSFVRNCLQLTRIIESESREKNSKLEANRWRHVDYAFSSYLRSLRSLEIERFSHVRNGSYARSYTTG